MAGRHPRSAGGGALFFVVGVIADASECARIDQVGQVLIAFHVAGEEPIELKHRATSIAYRSVGVDMG